MDASSTALPKINSTEGMELSKPSATTGRVTMVKYSFLLAHPKMTYASPYEAEEVVSIVDDGIQRQHALGGRSTYFMMIKQGFSDLHRSHRGMDLGARVFVRGK